MEYDINKLPKWAQRYIAGLVAKLDLASEIIAIKDEELKDCLLDKRPDLWRLDLGSKQKYISFDKGVGSGRKMIIDAYSMEDARAKLEKKGFDIRTLEPLAQYSKRSK